MPAATSAVAPVIIIGMHRSGTSMLTRTLQGLGFFMGRGTTRNEEAAYTNALNRWLFSQASATWERPEGMDTLLSRPELMALVSDYLRGVVDGPSCLRFLGLSHWLRHGSLHRLDTPWGWKDPRNTYTLPVWLSVFPEARILHIMRHGVDVAQSLRLRRQQAAEAAAARFQRRRWIYVNSPMAPKRAGFAHSARCADLAGGLALWQAYTERAQSHVRAAGERALELRYEDLLADPRSHLPRIADFCELRLDAAGLDARSALFKPDRAFAYRASAQLQDFARAHAGTLQALGYQP